MMSCRNRTAASISQALDAVCTFLEPHLPFANTHMTEFFVKDMWNEFIPTEIAQEALSLSVDQLVLLPSGQLYNGKGVATERNVVNSTSGPEKCHSECVGKETATSQRKSFRGGNVAATINPDSIPEKISREKSGWEHPTLKEFILKAQEHTLPHLGVVSSAESLQRRLSAKDEERPRVFIKDFMSPKKSYEIDIMADLCSLMAGHCGVDTVVDLGSGRGYLGSHLALMHGLRVLGVDCSSGNTHSAEDRQTKLKKYWRGLVRNAQQPGKDEDVAKGKRRANAKSVHRKLKATAPGHSEEDTPSRSSEEDGLSRELIARLKFPTSGEVKESADSTVGVYVPATEYVTLDTDLSQLVDQYLKPKSVCEDNLTLSASTEPSATGETHVLAQTETAVMSRLGDYDQGKQEFGNHAKSERKSGRGTSSGEASDATSGSRQSEWEAHSGEDKLQNQYLGGICSNSSIAQRWSRDDNHHRNCCHGSHHRDGNHGRSHDDDHCRNCCHGSHRGDGSHGQSHDDDHRRNCCRGGNHGDGNLGNNHPGDQCTNDANPLGKKPPDLRERKSHGLASDTCSRSQGNQYMLTGLHTCGDLASSMAMLFVRNRSVTAMCNVGCCYQHMEERFLGESHQVVEDKTDAALESRFPLSSRLRARRYTLGRNARMIASQAPDRATEYERLPSKSLYWRAVLQRLLCDWTGEDRRDWRVGKIAAKVSDFPSYVKKALKKLDLEKYSVPDADIEVYEKGFRDQEAKVYAFVQMRAALAPCVEALILLDRAAYLLEQDNHPSCATCRCRDGSCIHNRLPLRHLRLVGWCSLTRLHQPSDRKRSLRPLSPMLLMLT